MKKLFTVSASLLFAFTLFAQGRMLPYSTNFDSPAETAGWNQYRTGFNSTYSWTFAAKYLSHDYNVGGNAGDTVIDWMVSPPMHLHTAGQIKFKVQSSGFSTPSEINCQVLYSKGSPDPAKGNYVMIGNISRMEPSGTWLDTTLTIPDADDSGYVAFRYITVGAAWRTYQIDSVRITDQSTGIGSLAGIQAKVFPNPVREEAVMEFQHPLKDAELRVYNISGQAVMIQTGQSGSKLIFSRQGLVAGIYFMEVRQGGESFRAGKIVVAD